MNLSYTEEQVMLREQIQKFCETEYDFYKREDVVKSDKDFDENAWSLFAEQGWLSWTITEPKTNLLNLPHDLTLWKSIMRGLSPYHRILSNAPDEILSN